MRQVTGSRLPILQHCQWWARDDVSYTAPESGAAAGRGIEIHEAIDNRDVSSVAFEDVPAVQKGIAYLDGLRAAGWLVETEVPLALNYVTGKGRRLKSSGHRDYSDLKPNEVGLTVDYIAIMFGAKNEALDPSLTQRLVPKQCEVGDWKTGYGSHVEKASENWQLGGAAAALSDMYADCPVTAKVHFLDNDYIDSWTFNAMEAQRFGIWIRNRVELTATAMPNPGDHCRYCDARVQCPKTSSAIQQLIPEKVQWTLERISPENDAAMVMALPALESAVKAVKDALKARNPEGGLELPNGKVWKPILKGRSGWNTKAMAEKLESLGVSSKQFQTRTEYEEFRQVKP